MRLLGICLASFSTGLYSFSYYSTLLTLEFRLRRTNFPPTFNNIFTSIRRQSQCWVRLLLSPNFLLLLLDTRYFASGTGAAGLVGALLWWEMRSLGVRTGVGLSSVCPFPSSFVFHPSCLRTTIGSAPGYPSNLLLRPSA